MKRDPLVLTAVGLLVAGAACGGSHEATLTSTATPATTVAPATTAAPTTALEIYDEVLGSTTEGMVGDGVACDLPDGAGRLTIECVGLSFDVSVPETCLAGPCGLIVDVPGGTGIGEDADRHTGMQRRGNAAGYVVVQPNVPPEGWDYPVDSVRIRSVLEQLIETLDLDLDRVHVGGFSSGGYMAWAFVCDNADLIASAAPIGAGASTEDFPSCDFDVPGHPSEQVDIFLTHGRQDEIVSFDTALAQRDLVLAAWEMADPEALAAGREIPRHAPHLRQCPALRRGVGGRRGRLPGPLTGRATPNLCPLDAGRS